MTAARTASRTTLGPVLVTGASGLLGAAFLLEARDRGHGVAATWDRHPVGGEGIRSIRLDLMKESQIASVVNEVRPDWIVHCAAVTDVDACEDDEAATARVHVDASRTLARSAAAVGARLVHISTDAVFDGRRGGYAEENATGPVNAYARTKLAGELAVREALPERSLVIRTSIYGWNLQPKQSLAEWFLARLTAGERTPGFTDAIFTPILTNDLADAILDLMARSAAGTYHVAGSDAVSKYDFGVLVAREFGLDPALVRRASLRAAGLRAPRPADTSLRVGKVEDLLGRTMPRVREGLRRFRELREAGHVLRLKELGAVRAGD